MTATHFLDTSFLIDLVDDRTDAVDLHEEIAGTETTGTVCPYELSEMTGFEPATLLAGKAVLPLSTGDAVAAGGVFHELAR